MNKGIKIFEICICIALIVFFLYLSSRPKEEKKFALPRSPTQSQEEMEDKKIDMERVQ